jgi:hypothetical protein
MVPRCRYLAGVCALFFTVAGCCGYKARMRTPSLDYFERYVIVDVGTPPKCPLPKRRTEMGREVPVGRPTAVWVRSVAATDVRRPVTSGPVRLTLVTSFGDVSTDGEIVPAEVQIGPNGFATTRISVTIRSALQHFRIRAEFTDKSAIGVTYSPFLIPMSSGSSAAGVLRATNCDESREGI